MNSAPAVTNASELPGLPAEGETSDRSHALIAALASADPAEKVKRLVELGELFEERRRPRHARSCYETALELGESLSDRRPYLLALRRMARISQSSGELDRALYLYQTAYDAACAAHDPTEAASAATGLGNVKVDQGKWEQAENHYATALLHAEKAADEFQMGQLWNNLSVVHRRRGDLERSLDFSRRAIGVFERLGNRGELARCYNGLGLTQVERREFEAALETYQRALTLAESPHVTAAIHANVCELYLQQNESVLPEEEARLGEEIALRHGFNLILGNLYRTLGAFSRLRLDARGIDFLERALEIARQYQYLHAQAEVHFEYGLFRQSRGETANAIVQFEKALALYRHLGATNDIRRVEEILCGRKPEVGGG